MSHVDDSNRYEIEKHTPLLKLINLEMNCHPLSYIEYRRKRQELQKAIFLKYQL